jgi:hypothetical protein
MCIVPLPGGMTRRVGTVNQALGWSEFLISSGSTLLDNREQILGFQVAKLVEFEIVKEIANQLFF